VIVDTPGVGESQEFDDLVYQYLPEVFAFIFVLSLSDADGSDDNTESTMKVYAHKLLGQLMGEILSWPKWSHKKSFNAIV